MEPNQTTMPILGESVIDYMRTQRQNAGTILAILSIVFLALTIYMGIQAYKSPGSPEKSAEQTTNEKDKDKDFDITKPDAPKSTQHMTMKQVDFLLGAIGTLVAFFAVLLVAIWLLAGIPNTDVENQRTEARIQLLSLGGALGLLLIVFGAIYFYQWSESITNWLDKGQEKEQLWAILPLLFVVIGAGIVLLAVQPARSEERNNTLIRRLVYGANLGLTSLLLLVLLIVTNVVFSYRISNKFDTTGSGFYSMSPQTEEFLKGLDQPIQAYAILPGGGGRMENDLRDVLERFQETSRDMFKVTFVNSLTNSTELANLKLEYPPAQDGELGVLLTFPSDKKRFSFIPVGEFFSTERDNPSQPGEPARSIFIGEGRLVKELLFLADNKQKPKIYVTQSAGEMQFSSENEERNISSLKAFLEKNYLDLVPLTFDKDNPKVPDDCAVLMIPDPQQAFPANQVEAIRKYMTEPLTGGKKGKLIMLTGVTPPDPTNTRKKVLSTGLEGVLAQFNVEIKDKFMFGYDTDRRIPPYELPVGFTEGAARAKNPIVRLFKRIMISMFFPKEIDALNAVPTFTATPLLVTATNLGAWLEDECPSTGKEFERLAARASQSGQLRARTVAVVVSEPAMGRDSQPVARVAVFGNGIMVSNEYARLVAPESPPAFDLIGATIDWLRDRPPVPSGVQSKTYSVYQLPSPKTIDSARLRYLPLWLTLICVGGLGLGVWVMRRQQT